MDHLEGVGVEKSSDDVISGLGHHLAAEFTFSQITGKSSRIDKKCQWTIYRKLGSRNSTVTSFPV
jgi:hypothetical protein